MHNSLAHLQPFVDSYIQAHGPVKILEGGCGSMSRVRFGDKKYVVGIDISEKQLERNAALDEVLCGDIQTYDFPKQEFDIIICWDVLEHLETPEKAIENFFYACKPGGIIVLAFPNIYSLKGVITKLAPHPFHVWYYRHLLGEPDAGKDDRAPFHTFLKRSMSYPAIERYAREHDANVDLFVLRESDDMKNVRRKFSIINALIGGASWVSKALTFGKIDAAASDCIMVLRPGLSLAARRCEAQPPAQYHRDVESRVSVSARVTRM